MPELRPYVDDVHIFEPADEQEAEKIEIPRGPNIKRPPEHTPLGDSWRRRSRPSSPTTSRPATWRLTASR